MKLLKDYVKENYNPYDRLCPVKIFVSRGEYNREENDLVLENVVELNEGYPIILTSHRNGKYLEAFSEGGDNSILINAEDLYKELKKYFEK